MTRSQENCLFSNHHVVQDAQRPTSDGGGDFVMAFSHTMRVSSLYYFYKAGFFIRKYYAFLNQLRFHEADFLCWQTIDSLQQKGIIIILR